MKREIKNNKRTVYVMNYDMIYLVTILFKPCYCKMDRYKTHEDATKVGISTKCSFVCAVILCTSFLWPVNKGHFLHYIYLLPAKCQQLAIVTLDAGRGCSQIIGKSGWRTDLYVVTLLRH